MDHRQFAALRLMRMRISVAGFAMRGPTCMPDADMGVKIFAYYIFFQFGNFSFFLVYI
jgi:hypothetical protein